MANEQPTSKEMGLIKVASKHKRTVEMLTGDLRIAEQSIMKLAKALPEEKDAEEAVWDYAERVRLWWKGNSALLGVLTKIDNYTDKKGNTFLAHYTEYMSYIGRVTVEDPVPRPYDGYFVITKKRFRFMINREAKELCEFFQPSVENIEPLPVPVKKSIPIPRKIARPKVAKPVAEKPKWDDDE